MNIIASLLIASLFVPQGSEEQLTASPLQRGEVAYVNGETGESFVYVGTDEKHPRRVTDESALRGYQYDYLDRSEFVVLAVSNLALNASSDTLTFSNFQTGKTNTFVFTFSIPHKYKFDGVSYDAVVANHIGARYFSSRDISEIASDNIVTVTIRDYTDIGRSLTIKDFKVRVLRFGDPDYVNDLTTKIINVKDSVGTMQLGKWRYYLLHKYDGNRGCHWSFYQASNNVDMAAHEIHLGHDDKGLYPLSIGQDCDNTNIVSSSVHGRKAVRYYETDSTSSATWMKFTSVSRGDTAVTFTLAVSNATFNASMLKLYATDNVSNGESKWHEISYTVTGSSPITITTPVVNSSQQFYRLSYGDSHVVVEICDTLKVDRLLLKGDSGSYYRIGVNSSGVLTATLQQ